MFLTHIGQSLVTTSLNIFLLDLTFDKLTIGLHFFLISFILAKFSEDQTRTNYAVIKRLSVRGG